MMKKRIFALALALTLALGIEPAALAAARPVLCCGVEGTGGNVELTLEDLDGSGVYGVQIDMTLAGEYPDCVFEAASASAYAPDCAVQAGRSRTYVTIYLTDRSPLNQRASLCLGTLYAGAGVDGALPDTVRVILLDKDLKPMTGRMAGSFSTEITVRDQGKPEDPAPPSAGEPGAPSVPPVIPQLPGAGSAPAFADVRAGDWFYDAVAYVYGKGIMQGTGPNAFSPGASTDRAMIVTILYRLEGSPAALPSSFPDVAADAYYASPVAWASANGIVTGYDDGTFRPLAPITREQLAAILYRYAQYKGLVAPGGDAVSPYRFPDASSVSPYASSAVSWALGAGLLNGSDGYLLPQGSASRAQVAVILQRLCGGLMGMA